MEKNNWHLYGNLFCFSSSQSPIPIDFKNAAFSRGERRNKDEEWIFWHCGQWRYCTFDIICREGRPFTCYYYGLNLLISLLPKIEGENGVFDVFCWLKQNDHYGEVFGELGTWINCAHYNAREHQTLIWRSSLVQSVAIATPIWWMGNDAKMLSFRSFADLRNSIPVDQLIVLDAIAKISRH